MCFGVTAVVPLQTELSHSGTPGRRSAAAVTGHSTLEFPYDCFAFETGYPATCGGQPMMKARFR